MITNGNFYYVSNRPLAGSLTRQILGLHITTATTNTTITTTTTTCTTATTIAKYFNSYRWNFICKSVGVSGSQM